MRIIDRHIAARFLWNFVVLFALLFVFAISIDVILQLDRFIEAADAAVERGEYSMRSIALVVAVFNFHGPRVFQFYAYLLGLVSVAAMAFTFAQMHRHRELVALLASSQSLHRVARPVLVAAIGLNVLQIVNTEFVLPRLAPLLIREHGDILEEGLDRFPMPLTPDGRGNLMLARAFDPRSSTIEGLLALERDEHGTAVRRTTASIARWNAATRTWDLEGGRTTRRRAETPALTDTETSVESEPIATFETDLDPAAINMRHSATYAQMLSVRQLREVQQVGGADLRLTQRALWGRFGAVLVNLVVLLLAMPSFLLREPANLLRQSVECAAISVTAMLTAIVGISVDLPGVAPALGVFIPATVLAPLAIGRFLGVRS
ncbi:MAG: LptF/LptG family permease [Phycisphaerales bacterium]